MSGPEPVQTAIIVAGGKSSRMGTDKAELRYHGLTLLERTHRVCRAAGLGRVLIVGREQPLHWQGQGGVFLPDDSPHAGPLGGVATALEYVRSASLEPGELALALPCDMPLLDNAALLWLIERARTCRQEGSLGAVAVTPDGQVQPLFAVYSTALLPALQERLASGQRSLARLIKSERLMLAPVPEHIAPQLVSVNTPEEFDRVTREHNAETADIPRGIIESAQT